MRVHPRRRLQQKRRHLGGPPQHAAHGRRHLQHALSLWHQGTPSVTLPPSQLKDASLQGWAPSRSCLALAPLPAAQAQAQQLQRSRRSRMLSVSARSMRSTCARRWRASSKSMRCSTVRARPDRTDISRRARAQIAPRPRRGCQGGWRGGWPRHVLACACACALAIPVRTYNDGDRCYPTPTSAPCTTNTARMGSGMPVYL